MNCILRAQYFILLSDHEFTIVIILMKAIFYRLDSKLDL